MAIDPERKTTRRHVINAALGAAGGIAAAAIVGASPVEAVYTGNIQLGHGLGDGDNDSAVTTYVNGTTPGMVTFAATEYGSGTGLQGITVNGIGVEAIAENSGAGFFAHSNSGPAAVGASQSNSGVIGYLGTVAMPSIAGPVAGVVAAAASTSSLALRVVGRAAFDFSGRATVAKNHSSVTVIRAGVTASSLIIATPKTNRAGVYVQSVVPGAGKFTIYLSKAVIGTTYIAYMILG